MHIRRRFIPEENGITEGTIWKQLLLFFFPILFGTFFQQLYNTADAVIVGRFVGQEALASVGGSASVFINLLVSLFVGISSGATVIVAQYYGAHKYKDVGRAVQTSLALAITVGGIMTVLGILIAPAALRLIGTPENLFADTLLYLRVYLLGTIFSFLYNIGSAVLRAIGNTKEPLYFLMISCVVNIALDLLFVLVFRMGVLGVALATLVSQVVSSALVLYALRHADQFPRITRKNIRFTPNILTAILLIGIPAGLQSDMYSISNIILQSCINSFGTSHIAAWSAYGKIDNFFFMVLSAYGISITTFVGQNFGAKKYARIRKSVRICLLMAFGTALCFSAAYVLLRRPLLSLFTFEPQVLAIGEQILLRISPFYVSYICIEILSGTIRGVGEAFRPMLLTCCGVCILRIAWVVFVLPHSWNIETVAISYPITWAVTSLLFVLYYLHGGWLKKQIKKFGFPEEGAQPE